MLKTKKCLHIICSILVSSSLFVGITSAGCDIDWTETKHVEGAVLNLYGEDPYTLDPALAGDSSSIQYIMQIFSGLVTMDITMSPVADIASSWDISDDNLVYTFYLRDDVFFQGGKQVTAEDFKYSWERACNPITGSQTAPLYLGDVLGVDDVLAGETDAISGVKVTDDFTLQVTLDEPVTYFLEKLSYPVSFVVDEENVTDSIYWWNNPNGTGAFKLWEWDEGSQLVLERNNNYYGDVAMLDFIVYEILSGIGFEMYETGEIDVCDVGFSYIYKATDENGEYYNELYVSPDLSLMYMCFDCAYPPFDDMDIRRAFSMAVDKTKIISLVYNDMVMQADGIIPYGMPGFNEGLVGLDYNVEAALELIASSAYGDISNLPEITITTGGYGGQISSVLEAIVNEWRINLGVEVKIRQLDPDTFLYYITEEKDNMFFWGWSADYPHPQDFLEILFASYSEGNYGEYSNTEVDALLKLAAVEQDKDLSIELYRQAEQIIVDDAACISLYFGRSYILVKPYVFGYEVNALGVVNLNKVYIKN